MALTFPSFNLYSMPLLVLVTQGIIFGLLLLFRFRRRHVVSDLFLSLLVLITCYHRTTYTIGFMEWYDTFRNTKINYWLISLGLAIGPLIFFYVKSVTTSNFQFRKKELLHFVPVLLYVVYRIVIFIYDANQSGFDTTQNGELMIAWENGAVGVFTEAFGTIQQLLYLAFSLQLYFSYKKSLQDFFSDTYKMELNWIRNFLYIYTFLFLFSFTQQLVVLSVTELSWIQRWWYQFVSAIVVIYVGIKGYFTDTTVLSGLSYNVGRGKDIVPKPAVSPFSSNAQENAEILKAQKEHLLAYMTSERPYLDAELNLQQLSEYLNMGRAQLSEVINTGLKKNFNDFINEYRIEAVKKMLFEGKHKKLSLLGIAYECGFNSKATFNRVFKKLTNSSPTDFINNL
jgi:AraC-like DNA-binding protein